jgi:hypothetical protein
MISLVKHVNWDRCSCGAFPSTYHAQICGDQNAVQQVYVDIEYVEPMHLSDGSFAGFLFTHNLERGDHFIVTKEMFHNPWL